MQDPELSYTPKGVAVCKFTVASNHFYKQEEELQKEVSYFDVTTWTRLAEVCGEYLKKGRGVRVVGRLKQDRWTDQEGKGRSKVYIVAEHVEFKPQIKKDGDQAAQEEKPAEGTGAHLFGSPLLPLEICGQLWPRRRAVPLQTLRLHGAVVKGSTCQFPTILLVGE